MIFSPSFLLLLGAVFLFFSVSCIVGSVTGYHTRAMQAGIAAFALFYLKIHYGTGLTAVLVIMLGAGYLAFRKAPRTAAPASATTESIDPAAMYCPNCEVDLQGNLVQCHRCGALLSGDSTWRPVPGSVRIAGEQRDQAPAPARTAAPSVPRPAPTIPGLWDVLLGAPPFLAGLALGLLPWWWRGQLAYFGVLPGIVLATGGLCILLARRAWHRLAGGAMIAGVLAMSWAAIMIIGHGHR